MMRPDARGQAPYTPSRSGELLAAWLENEPLPLPRSVAEACHPNRFALRQLIRGKA